MEQEALLQRTKFRVHARSVAGMYAQYDGHIDVWAYNFHDAEDEAFKALKRGAFPERSRDMWRFHRIERIAS